MAKPDKNSPWLPPKYELPDLTAIQALARGEANADQQKRAMKWIVEQGCATYQPSYRVGPDGERNTVFAEGRRSVGLQIVSMLHINASALRRET
jgi:hypothetical protein